MSDEDPFTYPTAVMDAALEDRVEREGGITAAAGWCAPSDGIYDAGSLCTGVYEVITAFPGVAVSRVGLVYKQRTPAEQAAYDALQAQITRTVERAASTRAAAIDAACVIALANGWDLHVYDPPTPWDFRHANDRDLAYLRSVGIEFTPAEHPVPTIHRHPCPDYWDDDD